MDPVWLVMTILVAHVASVNAVRTTFKPATRHELEFAVRACIFQNSEGLQCCSGHTSCYLGAGYEEIAVDIEDWDTSLITDMSSLFKNHGVVGNTQSFKADISRWDTAQVTDMQQMFLGASAFNQDIGSWNTAQVKNMADMFD